MKRWILISAIVLVVALAIAVIWAYALTRRGLADLDGSLTLAGLAAEVTVERDDLGVPRILATRPLDAVRALGFLHGQERFFQMDLLRRSAAGELSELFGAVAVDADTRARLHRLRARARRAIETFTQDDRAELVAYTEGVNSGLRRAGRPFEYTLLRREPTPWRAEDSILAIHAMYLSLQDENARLDARRGLMRDTLSPAVVEFLLPRGSRWDAPLSGEAFETPSIPGPEQWNLRGPTASRAPDEETIEIAGILGSNNWAISADVSADGRAWVANDMHLPLGLPNIWYRASLCWTGDDGEPRRVTGVTLPGAPGVVAGSSDWIAWGFTNSQGDWSDLIELERVPGSEDRYLTPQGEATIVTFEETILVRGGASITVNIEETIWGPIDDTGHAIRWIAHDPTSANLGLLRLSEARSLEQAFAIVHAAGVPAQNFVAASALGRIGWTIAGPMPAREGYDGRFPVSWADGTNAWAGHLASADVPRILDPPSGRLWSANNRTVDGQALARIGDGGYVLGARARQIRDGLLALDAAGPEDLLAIQLDDRALFLEGWKDLLESLVRERTARLALPRWDDLLRQLETTWTGRASVDSVAYRMVRGWRQHVARRVFEPLQAPCRAVDESFEYRSVGRYEGPLWRILEERPMHLLDPSYESWNDLLAAAVEDLLDEFLTEPDDTLDAFTWGDHNAVVTAHPMSRSLPAFLARRMDIPTESLPGDAWMPRVQTPGHGASERFVVSPGNENAGLFHMPGGQSGHPFSPYYRKGHRAWAEGTPTPFLPGVTRHRLVLSP